MSEAAVLASEARVFASEARDHIALALDVPTLDEASAIASSVGDSIGVLKIGLELYTRHGPQAIERLRSSERRLFLDLKVHDIPETVARAMAAVSDLRVDMVTTHALGGARMLRDAVRAAKDVRVLAVTVLTSHDDADLRGIGLGGGPDVEALRLARLAWEAGVRGFVTSPREVASLRRELGPSAFLVTPGVRSSALGGSDDQRRVASPADAIADGSDLLVVGRPIRDAADRAAAARAVHDEVIAGLARRRDKAPR